MTVQESAALFAAEIVAAIDAKVASPEVSLSPEVLAAIVTAIEERSLKPEDLQQVIAAVAVDVLRQELHALVGVA